MSKFKEGQVVYCVYCNIQIEPKIMINVISYCGEYGGYITQAVTPYTEYFVNEIPIEGFKDSFSKRPKNAKLLEHDNGVEKHTMTICRPYTNITEKIDLKDINSIQKYFGLGYLVPKIIDPYLYCEWERDLWRTVVKYRDLPKWNESYNERDMFTTYDEAKKYCEDILTERRRFRALSEEDQCKEEITRYLASYYQNEELGNILNKLFALPNIENLEVKVNRYGENYNKKRVLYKYFQPSSGIRPLQTNAKWCGSMKKHREMVKKANEEFNIRRNKKWKELI